MIDKDRRQNTHEPCEHHHVRIVLVDDLNHGALKSFTGIKRLVIHHGRFNTHFLGAIKPGRIGAVGKHERNTDTLGSPIFPFAGLSNRHKVRAAARDQNNNVFHKCKCTRIFLKTGLTHI